MMSFALTLVLKHRSVCIQNSLLVHRLGERIPQANPKWRKEKRQQKSDYTESTAYCKRHCKYIQSGLCFNKLELASCMPLSVPLPSSLTAMWLWLFSYLLYRLILNATDIWCLNCSSQGLPAYKFRSKIAKILHESQRSNSGYFNLSPSHHSFSLTC